ncbi:MULTISPECIES: efflux RND transporter periplasmic adaptor subunit [Acetobacteraceae]|nr:MULTISPECIES: efflux RND transporter periplasmic adaptor subunit [Acetobacteraceae]MBB3173697.1 Cu(I)/Ag(I) efflux system membrane fusion protein [Endobacter medicaginis]MCX5475019.1 efflux RND transporter periplasmic adaptor subunit [Endobacter medicaginis]
MGLPDTSPVPKKDAMGMAYLPVYENEIRDAGTVFVPPGRLQILGVRTSVAAVQPVLNRSVHATGIAQFDERRIALVTSRVGGWVEHLDIAATGDPVWRGQVMAEIYAPDLVASEQEYLIATSLDPAMATAALERLRSLGAPETEIARLRRTRHAVRHIPVVAPADGVVTEKMAVEGARVGPDQPLYRTAATAPIWLIAEVQEQDLGAVRVGQQAHASLVAFPGRRFDGTVDFLYPSVSTETRTGRIRIVLPNADSVLRAGMYADIAIDVPASMAGPVLVVPSSSVIDSGTRQVVLVETGEGRFAPRSVRVGARGNDEAQILDGLKAGESVVVGANFLIDSESNLRAALQAFTVPDSKPARAGSAGR